MMLRGQICLVLLATALACAQQSASPELPSAPSAAITPGPAPSQPQAKPAATQPAKAEEPANAPLKLETLGGVRPAPKPAAQQQSAPKPATPPAEEQEPPATT